MTVSRTTLVLVLLTTACGSSRSTTDAGSDASTDASVDSGVDAGMDAGSDAGACGAPCRGNSDCHSTTTCFDEICYVPGEILCGGPIRPPPVSDCDGGDVCPSGQQCFSKPIPPCVTDMTPYFLCETTCTSTSCDAGMVCGSGGECVAQLCTAGFACQAPASCAPDGGAPDEHGCSLAGCQSDADCSGLFCVLGFCRAALGQCIPAPL